MAAENDLVYSAITTPHKDLAYNDPNPVWSLLDPMNPVIAF
jgi:hypothetical protein